MLLLWEDRAWDDYLYWQTQDKKMLKRINAAPCFFYFCNLAFTA